MATVDSDPAAAPMTCIENLSKPISKETSMTDHADHILRLPAVLRKTGLSRSTLYRKMDQGTFPRQIKISERCAGWRSSAVDAWLMNPMFYSANDLAS